MSKSNGTFSAGETIYTLRDLPQEMVSKIIGRRGVNIQGLKQGLHPSIQFDFVSNKNTRTSDVRIFVSGRGRGIPEEEGHKAIDALNHRIEQIEEEERAYQHNLLDQRWKIGAADQWAVGRIIGPKGANIKQLMRNTDLRLDISDREGVTYLQLKPVKNWKKIHVDEATEGIQRLERRLKELLTPRPGATPKVTFEKVIIRRAGMDWEMAKQIEHPLWTLESCRC